MIGTYPNYGYYASKAGLNHLTRAIAVHYASRGVRCNAVVPGVMDTPLIQTQIAGQYSDVDAMIAARASLFLAPDEAAYVTGVCLPVDGGLSCVAR